MTTRLHLFSTVLGIVLLAGVSSAQVTLKRGAVVYVGSATNTTAPATIDEKKVRTVTSEWDEIESDGVDLKSARGKQLLRKMHAKIKEAVKEVARGESRDLVVRKQDIADAHGREVLDLTGKVIAKLQE